MVGSWDKYCYNVRINNHKGAWYVCNGDAVLVSAETITTLGLYVLLPIFIGF